MYASFWLSDLPYEVLRCRLRQIEVLQDISIGGWIYVYEYA